MEQWSGASARLNGFGWRRAALALAIVLMLGSIGSLFASATRAGASGTTVFQSGQVFASVGNSTVNVYDPTSGDQTSSLTDDTGEPYTAGTAFDSNGNLYVADDTNGEISTFTPQGALNTQWNDGTYTAGSTSGDGVFAYGLSNPLSMVFDNQGNMYVGQQTTPYIAEFSSNGTPMGDIGPLKTELYGDDWIDLASDECTFYYTTEGTDIMTYNMCTNTQGPNFNQTAFPSSDPSTGLPVQAFELKILANGEVLVADSNAVLLLNQSGDVVQSYPCSSLPNCGGQLFAVSVDPSGTSFWTGDSASGNIYQIDIATGALMQTIPTHSGTLYGLSIDSQLEVATPAETTTAAPSTLSIQPVTGNFSTPTPVSAVLTNPSTDTPIVDEPVTFTLNGSETCTADTDATGTATCDIVAGEPSDTYTLTAAFSGDSSATTPIGSDTTSSTFTVNADTSAVTYTGPTSVVNGQPITLSGTLTTNSPTSGTPLPTKVVTFTIGSGSTAQSCNAVTDPNGNVSCMITPVNQPVTDTSIVTSFTGDAYDTPISVTTPVTVTEPTVLTVNTTTTSYNNAVTVSGVLTDAITNAPISGELVTFQLNGDETCQGTTTATGTASCSITPSEPANTYTLTGTFDGDTSLPLQLIPNTGQANFVVTPEATALNYTGGTTAQNGQPLTLSGVLTTSNGSGVGGQPVTFTLGSGATVQTCTVNTTPSGLASCVINVAGQPQGPISMVDSFAGSNYYTQVSDGQTVNLPEGTKLTVSTATGPYNGSTMVSATLVNSYTNAVVPNESVTLAIGGNPPCTATTNANGVASCSITTTGPPGNYSLTASFGGDTTVTPVLLGTSGSSTFVETKATPSITYTGSTTTTSGQAPVLSATLMSPSGAPLAGQTLTFTVGTGTSAQRCTATTNASGSASCNICMYNQTSSPLPVTVTYGGNTDYSQQSVSESVTVVTPTTLAVSAGTGTYGQTVTLSGTLTSSVTGQGVGGQSITLTLNGSQTCTATAASNGKASCPITANETAGTYTVTGSFTGNTATSPQLVASNGSNKVVITGAPTSISYTGATTVQNGSSLALTAQLTSNGSALSGQPVTLTLGTGNTAQSCTGTTGSTGAVSCTLSSVNQVAGTVTVTVSYAGNGAYAGSSTTAGVKVSSCGGTGSGGSSGGSGCGGSGSGGCGSSEPPPVGGGRGYC